MVKYSSLSKRPVLFQQLTGLKVREFEEIRVSFEQGWEEFVQEKFLKKARRREFGGGRRAVLEKIEDKLLFILTYTRVYPLMFVQGIMFGLAESNVCLWVHRLLPLLDKALGKTHQRPARQRGRSLEEVLEEFPELREMGVLVDGTERPTRRPKDPEKQKERYSGKKKRHSVKNIVLSRADNGRVLYLGKTQPGSLHDKTCLEKEELHCRNPMPVGADLGFQGVHIENLQMHLPYKKPRGGLLTQTQRQENRIFSGVRVEVEHAIAGIKRNRSVSDIYRNFKEGVEDTLMSIACGLHNFRIAARLVST